MAKKKKTKAKKGALTVNFEGVEAGGGGKHIKAGPYVAKKLPGTELKKGQKADFYLWKFEITSGKNEGWKNSFVTSLGEDSKWSLKGLLLAFGVSEKDLAGDYDLDPSDFDGEEVMIMVEDSLYNGRTVSSIVFVDSTNNAEDDDDDDNEGDDDDITADDINGMKKAELAELIDDEELDVDPADFKGKGALDNLREAVAEAMELDDEEDDEEDEGYTEAAVLKMKKAELVEIIEENELDVKPDSKKLAKIGKLRQAVIDALEEEDLLEEDDD